MDNTDKSSIEIHYILPPRYKGNRDIMRAGMRRLGFREMLDDTHEGYIITAYWYPNTSGFNFSEFYLRLRNKGNLSTSSSEIYHIHL